MALSFCSNWETMDQLNSNLAEFYDPRAELAGALIGLHDPIDSLFHPPPPPPNAPFAYAEPAAPVSNLLPSFSDPSIISSPVDIHSQEFDFCRCRRRPSCGDLCQSSDLVFEANSHNAAFVATAISSWPLLGFGSNKYSHIG